MPTIAVTFLCLAFLSITPLSAQNEKTFGDYTIHYNAVTTDFLDADTARAYGIRRSKSRALLSLTVFKNSTDGDKQHTEATILANAINLTGQTRVIDVRQVTEEDALYYIGEFRVSNEETFDIRIDFTPTGETQPLHLSFRQQFFIDG